LNEDLVKGKNRWQRKKLQIQGAQILRNEAYLQYTAVTKDVAQRRSWTFYEAIIEYFKNTEGKKGTGRNEAL